jgi:hypothetical protein
MSGTRCRGTVTCCLGGEESWLTEDISLGEMELTAYTPALVKSGSRAVICEAVFGTLFPPMPQSARLAALLIVQGHSRLLHTFSASILTHFTPSRPPPIFPFFQSDVF